MSVVLPGHMGRAEFVEGAGGLSVVSLNALPLLPVSRARGEVSCVLRVEKAVVAALVPQCQLLHFCNRLPKVFHDRPLS